MDNLNCRNNLKQIWQFHFLEWFFKSLAQIIYHEILWPFLNVTTSYHIRANIGEELNLANQRIAMQSPSLNLTNIFSIVYHL